MYRRRNLLRIPCGHATYLLFGYLKFLSFALIDASFFDVFPKPNDSDSFHLRSSLHLHGLHPRLLGLPLSTTDAESLRTLRHEARHDVHAVSAITPSFLN